MNSLRIALIGGGHMGRALVEGLIARGASAARIAVAEALPGPRDALARDLGVRVTVDAREAIDGADVVLLAVKPQDLESAVVPLRDALTAAKPLVISIAAGVRLRALNAWCGDGVPVVRAMPNRPALVGAGATGLHAAGDLTEAHRALASRMLEAVGVAVWVASEDDLDVVTALSGSGPAYFFLLAEEMARSATRLGLDDATAHRLAVATLDGAGRLAHASDGDLARLRAEVTSKGGTTEAALEAFHAGRLGACVDTALEAATQRGRDLAARFGDSSQ